MNVVEVPDPGLEKHRKSDKGQDEPAGKAKAGKKFKLFRVNQKNAPYVFLLPIIIIFSAFMIYPIVSSFIMSFQEFSQGEFHFVGLNNYIMLMKDPVFKSALTNNMIYFVIQVPIMVFLALLLANVLNMASLRAKTFFRISIFLPAITALVAYSLVFMLLLNTEYGLVNYILSFFGLGPVDWLNTPTAARISLMLSITWRWTGYNMIIMIAGLQGIPLEIYEAANIDGASAIDKFFKITVPMMKPIILFCMITSTIGTLQLFDESYILTAGGPDNATITVAHYLYNTGFRYIKFGYAAAISYALVIIIGVFSFIQFKLGGSEK